MTHASAADALGLLIAALVVAWGIAAWIEASEV